MAAYIPYSRKHPISLPHDHYVTKLFIKESHRVTLHGDCALTSHHLRSNFWVNHGKNAIKKEIRKCIVCIRYRKEANKKLMGQLPAAQVQLTRPFLHTGCDFAGPILIKNALGRGNRTYKAYICIFICMATKAIHIELVTGLTVHAFIACLKRFIARRGQVCCLYSDNGTNFVKANKILRK